MEEISFQKYIAFTSELPDWIDGSLLEFPADIWSGVSSEVVGGTVTGVLENVKTVIPPPIFAGVVFRDVFTSNPITYTDIYSNFVVGSEKILYDAVIGSDSHGAVIKLRWKLKCISMDGSNCAIGSQLSLIIRQSSGMPEVESVFAPYAGTGTFQPVIWSPTSGIGPYGVTYIRFGMGLYSLPGREDDISEQGLIFFLGEGGSTTEIPTYVTISNYNDANDQRVYNVSPWTNKTSYSSTDLTVRTACIGFVDFPTLKVAFPDLEIAAKEISPEAGEPSEEGGMDDPTFDDSSDTIDLPAVPDLGVSNVGFVNVYKTGTSSLQNIGVELFPPLAYTAPTAVAATDTTEAIVNGFNALVTFFANIPSFFDQMVANTLINYVIDCHIIPVTPSTLAVAEPIQVGWKQLTTSAAKVSSDYVTVSCGSISIGEYYANFADFLTTAKLYLPFVGFVPVRPEWFQNDTLKVDYRFNVIDGSFTAYVRSGGKYVNNHDSTGTIVGQYSGNACIHLPITGVTYASMVSGLVGAGAGMAAGAASGNIAAMATSAIGAASTSGDIAQSNAYSSSAAFLGCRYPFLMIERPVSSYAKNYQHEIGIPSNIYAKLSQLSGFVKMENVHVDGITGATDEEKEEIRKLLASGVIV